MSEMDRLLSYRFLNTDVSSWHYFSCGVHTRECILSWI